MLARKLHTAGNATRYVLDYSQWLPEGVHIVTVAVSLVDPVDGVSVTAGVVGQTGLVYFTVSGGAVKDTFTVQVEITDSIEETDIRDIGFSVVSP